MGRIFRLLCPSCSCIPLASSRAFVREVRLRSKTVILLVFMHVCMHPQAPKARPGEGGSTIDFSSLFADLDSDLSSDGESDESDDYDDDSAAAAAVEHEDTRLDQGGKGGGDAG